MPVRSLNFQLTSIVNTQWTIGHCAYLAPEPEEVGVEVERCSLPEVEVLLPERLAVPAQHSCHHLKEKSKSKVASKSKSKYRHSWSHRLRRRHHRRHHHHHSQMKRSPADEDS